MNFGDTIRVYRRNKGLTQADLAAEIDISKPYMNQIEQGKPIETIGENIIKKIVSVLDIPVEALKNIDNLNYHTANTHSNINTNISTNKSITDFEAERSAWQNLEKDLRETIAAQKETIESLKELLAHYKRSV